MGWGGKCRAWAAHLLDFAGLLEDGERAIGSHRLLHHHGLLHHHVGLHLRGPMDGGKEGRRDQANRLFSALLSRRVRVRLGRGANRAVIGARYRADGGTVRRRRGDCIQRAACQAVSGAGAGLSRRCLNLFFRHWTEGTGTAEAAPAHRAGIGASYRAVGGRSTQSRRGLYISGCLPARVGARAGHVRRVSRSERIFVTWNCVMGQDRGGRGYAA